MADPGYNILDYNEIDINNIEFSNPIKVKGGSYVSVPKYEGEGIYIQTPRLLNKGFIKSDQRCSLELELDKSHLKFYEFITNIDDFNIIEIQKNSIDWFKQDFPLDIVEEFYKSPVKMARSKKAPSLKLKVPLVRGNIDSTIYNKNNDVISHMQVKENSKILTVLHFYGLRFLKQQVICEWVPIQLKVFQDDDTVTENKYIINDNLLSDNEDENEHFNDTVNQEIMAVEEPQLQSQVSVEEPQLQSHVSVEEPQLQSQVSVEESQSQPTVEEPQSQTQPSVEESQSQTQPSVEELQSQTQPSVEELQSQTQQSVEESQLIQTNEELINLDNQENIELEDLDSNNDDILQSLESLQEVNISDNESDICTDNSDLEDNDENILLKEVENYRDQLNQKNERILFLENTIRSFYNQVNN